MNTQFTIEEAIAQYENSVEEKYTTNGKVDRDDIWLFTNELNAIELLQSVVTENDDDEECVELFEKLANIEGSIERVIYNIVNDDYILGDWGENTDYHEYNEWTMDIVSNVLELLSEEN